MNCVQTFYVNFGLKWLYLAFLALQFVLALGNRPKGERLTYNITLWVFGVLSLYLLVCSLWLTVVAFKVCFVRGIFMSMILISFPIADHP